MKNFLLLTIIAFLFSNAGCQNSNVDNSDNYEDSLSVNTEPIPVKVKKDSVSIIAVGDIMLGSIGREGWIPPNNDCTPFFTPLKPILSDADITFGNFEGVFTDSNTGAKKCKDLKYCYVFGMPTKYAECFKDAGFDILNIANNHSNDYGQNGINTTMKVMDEYGFMYAGWSAKPWDTTTVDGLKIGFCGYAPGGVNCQITNLNSMEKTVRHLDTICDIVIVSFHGGAEGKDKQHVTRETEYYLGQNRGNVYEFSHRAIDAGGDVILGHGPHVTRAIELYNDRLIVYSMGNFATYHFITYGPFGMAPIFKIYTDNEGKFLKGKIFPVYPETLGPRLDPKKAVIKKLQELTSLDFPKTPLTIDDEGNITVTEK